MNIDEITRKYLKSCLDIPEILPEGWEYKFGLRGKFKYHNSIEELEQAHLEYDGMTKRPFAYSIPTWETKEKVSLLKRMLPDDEIWEVTQNESSIIWIIRDKNVILKEYACVKIFIGGASVKLPDPDFHFNLDAL